MTGSNESTPLYIQDVIEILTNIKLKHGNLPVYCADYNGDMEVLTMDNEEGYLHGVRYCEPWENHGFKKPERVEIT